MTYDLSRRGLVAAIALLPTGAFAQDRATASLSADDRALVDKAVAYLQTLTSIKGRFVQTDARGRSGGGDFFLKRPGKVRFAYDAPNDLLVVSDGSRVMVHDKRLKTFNAYALNMTPLSLFLAREIRLDKGVEVTEVRRYADGFSITARDKGKETAGQITLVFGDNPMSLREWTVIDAQGQRTRVTLSGLRPATLENALFVLRDPRPSAGGRP
jgi:outer membrane lipoprotein-sorting protein